MSTRGHKRMKILSVREDAPGYGGEVALYKARDGSISLEVRLKKETLWLNLNQMAALFERDKSVISRHLRNVYKEGELDQKATVAFFASVQDEGGRRVTRQLEYYSLDVIISVGYRVNSQRGTQFRIWATTVLRDHLIKGYTVNERRLKELRQSIRIMRRVLDHYDITSDQAMALLEVISDYEGALDLIDDYDHQRLRSGPLAAKNALGITYEEAKTIVGRLRVRFEGSELFGREKDDSLNSSLNAVMQTFDGRDVYPSLEEKAAHLLYFLVKNHSFVDGNKRIAASLFLWVLN